MIGQTISRYRILAVIGEGSMGTVYAAEHIALGRPVGAIDEDHMRPPFANRGPQMSVVAPGVSIFSTLPNYIVTANTALGKETKFDLLSGTSQATALVSALAALVWSKSPQLTAEEVRSRIANTSTTLSGSRNDFGSGIINVEAALS